MVPRDAGRGGDVAAVPRPPPRRGRVCRADAKPVLPVGYITNPRGPVTDLGRFMAGGEVLWRSRAAVDAAGTSLRCRGRRRGRAGNAWLCRGEMTRQVPNRG